MKHGSVVTLQQNYAHKHVSKACARSLVFYTDLQICTATVESAFYQSITVVLPLTGDTRINALNKILTSGTMLHEWRWLCDAGLG